MPGDDPWTEHARWFNRCGFLRLVKGDDFIQDVLRQKPPQQVPEEDLLKRRPYSDEELERMMDDAICKVRREAVFG